MAEPHPSAEAVDRMVRQEHDFVWRSLRRLGVPSADVDDVLQDVFVRAVGKLDDMNDARGFLFRTCVFFAANARRALRRRRVISDETSVHAAVDPAASPEHDAAVGEARDQLASILERMSEAERSVFVLFELERMTAQEIATMLSIPSGTVASRLRRARAFFFEALEHEEPGS